MIPTGRSFSRISSAPMFFSAISVSPASTVESGEIDHTCDPLLARSCKIDGIEPSLRHSTGSEPDPCCGSASWRAPRAGDRYAWDNQPWTLPDRTPALSARLERRCAFDQPDPAPAV